jgi:thioredoxin-like negative regulator of GroEL
MPMVHGLQAKYEGEIQFTYLNIDDPNTRSFKQTLGYRAQPHFFLLDANGKIVEEWLGFVQESDLVTAFGVFK